MNTTERIINMEDTLRYLVDKCDREFRIIKSLLRNLIEKMENSHINDLSSSIRF